MNGSGPQSYAVAFVCHPQYYGAEEVAVLHGDVASLVRTYGCKWLIVASAVRIALGQTYFGSFSDLLFYMAAKRGLSPEGRNID
jgi:hypothetical protein